MKTIATWFDAAERIRKKAKITFASKGDFERCRKMINNNAPAAVQFRRLDCIATDGCKSSIETIHQK